MKTFDLMLATLSVLVGVSFGLVHYRTTEQIEVLKKNISQTDLNAVDVGQFLLKLVCERNGGKYVSEYDQTNQFREQIRIIDVYNQPIFTDSCFIGAKEFKQSPAREFQWVYTEQSNPQTLQ